MQRREVKRRNIEARIRERKLRKEMEKQRLQQWNRNRDRSYKERIQRPLFREIEEDFRQKVELPKIQKRNHILREIRDARTAPIDHKRIKEEGIAHQKKVWGGFRDVG